jgi:2-phosphoglycerate kinase
MPTWIGGSPCSGKSTLARALATEALYSCDDAFDRHAAAIDPQLGPTLKKVTGMPVAERLDQPIGVQVDDVFRLYREEFPLILDDVAGLSDEAVIEGAALLPELVAARQVPVDRAVWIVPTEEFQRRHYARRPWALDLLKDAPDPDRLFDRWMRRDASFAAIVADQARSRGYPVIVVDGSASPRSLLGRLPR